MSRDDLARLCLRILALGLGAYGTVLLGAIPTQAAGTSFDPAILVVGVVPIGGGFALWHATPWLARRIFTRGDDAVPLTLNARDIPALACFVVGIWQIAAAAPQAAGWLAVEWARRSRGGLMGTDIAELDTSVAALGAGIVTRAIVGAVLLALSRRPALLAPRGDSSADAADGDPSTDA